MIRSFFVGSGLRLAALATLLLSLFLLARVCAPKTQDAFFGMLFPQLLWGDGWSGDGWPGDGLTGEATPAEATPAEAACRGAVAL